MAVNQEDRELPLEDRLLNKLFEKKERIKYQQEVKNQKEMENCTFQPELNRSNIND